MRPIVDPLVDRLAHAPGGEGVSPLDVRGPELGARLVKAEVERLIALGLQDFEARRGGDPLELVRRRGLEHVDLAREQQLGAPGRVGDPRLHDPIDVVRMLREAPPVGVADEHRALARLELLEHERAGAIGMRLGIVPPVIAQLRWQRRAVALRPGLRHDGKPGQVLPWNWVGGRGGEFEGCPCLTSAPTEQIEGFAERRISGSSQ